MVIVNEKIEVSRSYEPFGIIFLEDNGCCPGRPIVLTRTSRGVISAQCACGGWCTNGHRTATAAVKEYEYMSRGRGIWDAARLSEQIKALEECVLGVDRWENEIRRVRDLYGDD